MKDSWEQYKKNVGELGELYYLVGTRFALPVFAIMLTVFIICRFLGIVNVK